MGSMGQGWLDLEWVDLLHQVGIALALAAGGERARERANGWTEREEGGGRGEFGREGGRGKRERTIMP